jgi:hypothetical protein
MIRLEGAAMRITLVALFGFTLGCGTSSDDGSKGPGAPQDAGLTCDTLEFAACGGDPVGRWQLHNYCGDEIVFEEPAFSNEACADSTTRLTTFPTVLTQTFNADLTYEIVASSNVDFVADVTETCVNSVSGGMPFELACPYGETLLTENFEVNWESISCEVQEGVCHCAGTGTTKDFTDSGTYALGEAGTIVLTSANPNSQFTGDSEYCVDGDYLLAHDTTDTGDDWYAILKH